jgi:hypothetical protein
MATTPDGRDLRRGNNMPFRADQLTLRYSALQQFGQKKALGRPRFPVALYANRRFAVRRMLSIVI